jgi:hypothetical protein
MADHSEVSPDTLPVALTDQGIAVEYTDGREVFYHGVPTAVETPHTTAPGKDVHVLVVDEEGTRGVLVYVNERKTGDDILDESGVGRVLVGREEEAMVFPGVTVDGGQYRVTVRVDHGAVDGRVFVFEEDQFEERSFEIVDE